MNSLLKNCLKLTAAGMALSAMMVVSTEKASALDWVDITGKTHLYWNGGVDVRKFVDYKKTVTNDDITWEVTFNGAKEKWVYPDFAVFLPKEVEAPTGIDIVDDYRDGRQERHHKNNTQWFYDWDTQKGNFNSEWEKFPGWTGWSASYDRFTRLKDNGGFSRVLVDNYGYFGSPEEDRKLGHTTTWTFKTKLKEEYKGKGNNVPFLAGIKQNNPLAYSYPSYIGEFGSNN
ncbi:hypothetical protein [Streptococcus phocae]|nr:hypothetical protein [Streptococcus phocae]